MVRSLSINTLQIWLRIEDIMADSILRAFSPCCSTSINSRFVIELFYRKRSLQKNIQRSEHAKFNGQ